MRENSAAIISKEEVQACYEEFLEALKAVFGAQIFDGQRIRNTIGIESMSLISDDDEHSLDVRSAARCAPRAELRDEVCAAPTVEM
jgi:hypothetical protein